MIWNSVNSVFWDIVHPLLYVCGDRFVVGVDVDFSAKQFGVALALQCLIARRTLDEVVMPEHTSSALVDSLHFVELTVSPCASQVNELHDRCYSFPSISV